FTSQCRVNSFTSPQQEARPKERSSLNCPTFMDRVVSSCKPTGPSTPPTRLFSMIHFQKGSATGSILPHSCWTPACNLHCCREALACRWIMPSWKRRRTKEQFAIQTHCCFTGHTTKAILLSILHASALWKR